MCAFLEAIAFKKTEPKIEGKGESVLALRASEEDTS